MNDLEERSRSAVLGTRVRSVRLALGMTQTQLAARSDLSVMTISRVEAAQGSPTIDTLGSIATALECPISFLLDENE